MKRFLVDAFLVLMLVSLCSYLSEPQPDITLDEKIAEFEDEVARHDGIKQKVEDSHLNNIHENHAAELAKAGSDFVIDVMDKGMHIVSEFVFGLSR